MTYIPDADREAVRQRLEEVVQRPVTMALFSAADGSDCEYCEVMRDILQELAELHPDLNVALYDVATHAEYAAALGIARAPAVAFLGGSENQDYGIRYYGLASGYEFATILEAIAIVGQDKVELQPATRALLDELKAPLKLQVFVTPTCPYCPRAVVQAYRLAHASPHIIADGVEVSEFPELGDRYGVMGVPHTVIDESVHFTGAVPEGMLLGKLKEAIAQATV